MKSGWIPRSIFDLATTLQGQRRWKGYLRELEEVADSSRQEVLDRQEARLLRLLTFATSEVEHYRHLSAGAEGSARQDAWAWLRDLPLLEKQVLQKTPERLHGDLDAPTTPKSTGGSTGEPVRLLKTADGVAVERACSWLGLSWFGIRPGDPAVRFWGTPLTRSRRIRFRLADLAMNRIRLSAFDIDEADLAGYYDRIRRFRPAWFYGYASLIAMMAEWIDDTGRSGTDLGLKAIVPTSEPLTEAQRDRIHRVFGAPIQNEYGCGEVGAMAYECEMGRLHLMTESVVVEVVKEDGTLAAPGETGEVVVTDLNNFAMPLIRYRMRDRAVRGGECACGRPFPTLERVVGRIHDVVYTPLGRRWHGEKIDYLMSSIHQDLFPFQRYQVVQREPDLLEVRFVAEAPIPDPVRRSIADYVTERLDGMRTEVVRVDRIERSPSGKLRLVRNDVDPSGESEDQV